MLKLTYFCLNLLVQQINSVIFFLKLKSNYIEKLNIETKKAVQKSFIKNRTQIADIKGFLQKRFDTVVANKIVSGMV